MKNFFKTLLIFSAGGLIGGAVGYFIGTKKVLDSIDEEIEKNVEEIRQYYEERRDAEIKSMLDAVNEREEEKADSIIRNPKPDIMSIERDYFDKVEEAVKVENARMPQEGNEGAYSPKIIHKNIFDEALTVYQIDEETFSDLREDYDKEYLTYYKDHIVAYTDNEDEVMSGNTVNDILGGFDNLDIGFEKSDNKPIYFRNEKLGTDYQIEVDYRDYLMAVGHEPFDETKSD